MTDPEPHMSSDTTSEVPDPPAGFLRRTVAPAIAIVILYASIRALPSLLVSQPPPIDGGDLLTVFLISLAVFAVIGLYTDLRFKSREADRES